MFIRVATTCTLWAIIALVIVFGKLLGGQALLLAVALGVLWEIAGLLQRVGLKVNAIAMMISLGLALGGHLWGFASLGTSVALIIILAAHWKTEGYTMTAALASVIIVSVGLGSVAAITALPHPHAVALAVWVMAVIKLSDANAYLVGRYFGKRALASTISPAKSIEGLYGAIGAGILIGSLGIPLLGHVALPLILGGVLAIVGAIGDLAESALKRWAKVKDSGHLLPGIGGMLDLCDSIIVGAPVAYLALNFLA